MFVHDFAYVDLPVEAVRRRVLAGGDGWLSTLAEAAADEGEALRIRVGPMDGMPRIGKVVSVDTAAPYVRGDVMVMPLVWHATGVSAAFPVLQADLEVAPIGDDRTQLSLLGRYDPPLGPLGRRLDALLFHRLAEASVRSFLRRVAGSLETEENNRLTAAVAG
jgi:hypothetical protein